MLTARDGVDDRVAGLDAGADDYLVKPFALKELLARLRALTRRADDLPRMSVLQIADLILDTRTHRVERDGRRVSLTAKEMAVLECLMRSRSRCSPHADRRARVDYDVLIHSNVVDVYIRNLRRKLDDDATLKLIHTVRGAGYRLSVEQDDETS